MCRLPLLVDARSKTDPRFPGRTTPTTYFASHRMARCQPPAGTVESSCGIWPSCLVRPIVLVSHNEIDADAAEAEGRLWERPAASATLSPRHADLDAPRRHLGIFALAQEVQLGGAVSLCPANSRTTCIWAPLRMA